MMSIGHGSRFCLTLQWRRTIRATLPAILSLYSVGCRPTAPIVAASPASRQVTSENDPVEPARLPPVPPIVGAALQPRLQYPANNQLIARRDSSFVLGSVGSGDAQLWINGITVPVAPNGAFIAWLPNPGGAAPQYDLVATRGADTVRHSVRVRYGARAAIPATGSRLLDSGSVTPTRSRAALPAEFVRVSVRAAANARMVVRLSDGAVVPMSSVANQQRAALRAVAGERNPLVDRTEFAGDDIGTTWAADIAAERLATSARIIATRERDSMAVAVPAVRVLSPTERVVGMLRSNNLVGSDTDRVVNARTIPDGTYKWMLLPGTVVPITGQDNGSTRIRLDDALDVWVSTDDIVTLPAGSALPKRVTGGMRVTPAREWADVVIPMGDRPAFLVEPDGRTMVLTLYGVQMNPEISPIIGNDTLIRRISWDQVGNDRVRVTFTLSQPVYGWLSLWDENRRAFVLRVRRVPDIQANRPLAGLTIAVDPGHPPAGATGPTGLYEGDAVLPVGHILMELLRAKGALPVLTRDTKDALGLTERNVLSRRANAHAFVSVHLNALPDGVNPFTNNGTSTLFFHQSSEPLARPVQSAMMKRFGLRDLGVHYQNLAVARPSWYPSVLTEGLFVIMPEQEAAMRNPAFQRRYAEAIVVGLEQYFRWLRTAKDQQ